MAYSNILVTGGAGFIGSNFIHYVIANIPGINIVNLDLLTYAGCLENLYDVSQSPRYTFYHGDICNADLLRQLMSDHQIDAIVHFAAESHVDRSIYDASPFLRTNILGTHALLEAARNAWKFEPYNDQDFRFHHISTDEIYGSLEPNSPKSTEKSPYLPNSPYAASKAASDHLVRAYHATYGLPVTITNSSNNYGPYQFPEKLIPLCINNAIRELPIPVYGDGGNLRDWIQVEDHCAGIWAAITKGQPGSSYNLGGGNQVANIDLIKMVCAILDERSPRGFGKKYEDLVIFVQDRPGHDRRYALDTTKALNELGWRPYVSLNEGLQRTVDWYLANWDWVEKIWKKSNYSNWVNDHYNQRGDK